MGARPAGFRDPRDKSEKWQAAFVLYCLFVVSYFTHLGARVSFLGALRLDILLCVSALFLAMAGGRSSAERGQRSENGTPATAGKMLLVMIAYILGSLPFVRWPGSVLSHGWEPFLKAVIFYPLTVLVVTSERRMAAFLFVFIATQAFRVLEPLYLHVTTGYWGSFTNMGNYELMNRLSGAPFDVVNPNGLAFIILVVVTLSYHVMPREKLWQLVAFSLLIGAMLYALSLTGSRSGMVVMAVFALLVVWKSKRRLLSLSVLAVIVTGLLLSMDDLERQRYLSIVDHSAKGGESAQGRIDGLKSDFLVGMQRPIFGHGLGTSLEANANAAGEAAPSHNMYTEVFQELGVVGLVIVLAFLARIWKNCLHASKFLQRGNEKYLRKVATASKDLLVVLLVFSLASYGLSEYQWYLLGGLSAALMNIVSGGSRTAEPDPGIEKTFRRSTPGTFAIAGRKL